MGTRGFKGWMLRASSRIALPSLKRLVMLSAKHRAGGAVPLCGGTDAQTQWDGRAGAQGCGAQVLCLLLLVVRAPVTPAAEHCHQLLASRCPLAPRDTAGPWSWDRSQGKAGLGAQIPGRCQGEEYFFTPTYTWLQVKSIKWPQLTLNLLFL